METKEFPFSGFRMNGFVMLFLHLVLLSAAAAGCAFLATDAGYAAAAVLGLVWLFVWAGYIQLEPNEARAMVFFGNYRGTFRTTGFFWVNPFYDKKKLSLRARNLDVEPIKVNDKAGNPILIGLVLVWKLRDTYKAMFEIDAQTMAAAPADGKGAAAGNTPPARRFFLGLQYIKKSLYRRIKARYYVLYRAVDLQSTQNAGRNVQYFELTQSARRKNTPAYYLLNRRFVVSCQ